MLNPTGGLSAEMGTSKFSSISTKDESSSPLRNRQTDLIYPDCFEWLSKLREFQELDWI
jgi:hypothetical protein